VKIEKEKSVFLLGGKDLEMQTIKDFLLSQGFRENVSVFDFGLSWGAKLSAYREILEKNKHQKIYAVELEIDDRELLEQYDIEIIDHHGAESDKKPSSLFQVLSLLGLKPSREQELISANDTGYIRGMQALRATDKEIMHIRKRDCTAQGITKEDERVAKNDVSNREIINCITVIEATTSKFAAITDALYFDVADKQKTERTVIYNDETLVSYGFAIKDVIALFDAQGIDGERYYYGGGENGFVGIKAASVNTQVLHTLKEALLMLDPPSKALCSTHIFMFPFIFMEDVQKVNEALVGEDRWQYRTFDTGRGHESYNEYVYFYEHVRKALYNNKAMGQKQSVYYFEYQEQRGEYILELFEKEYRLDIVGISMRTFQTGVGILALELENRDYFHPDDILKINDFGRRLFPQFLTQDEKNQNNSLDEVRKAFLPVRVGIALQNGISKFEDFSYYQNRSMLSCNATNLPCYLHHLLGEKFTSYRAEDTPRDAHIYIEPIIDDRMFVISLYMNDKLAEHMKWHANDRYTYEEDDFWYEYVYIDGNGKTCQSRPMTSRLLQEVTYDRWVEWGTLFGTSRYSFVALSGSWFGVNRLEPHMRTMYFQMFTLLLAYRASILRFSNRVAELTLKEDESFDLNTLQKRVSQIYKDYINFENNLLFREITAQEQGIEIYDQAMEVMQIDKQVKDLDVEIAELHTYVSMRAEELRNDRLETISKLGAVFLPPSLLAGLFGMNIFSFEQSPATLFVAFVLMCVSAILGFYAVSRKEKRQKNIVGNMPSFMIGTLFFTLTLFAIIYFLMQDDTSRKSSHHIHMDKAGTTLEQSHQKGANR